MARRKLTTAQYLRAALYQVTCKYADRGYTAMRYTADTVVLRKKSRCGSGVYHVVVNRFGRIIGRNKIDLSPIDGSKYCYANGRYVRKLWLNYTGSTS